MKNVALYVRSATVEQSGKSKTREQLKNLRKFAKDNNYKVVAEYEDAGQSGSNLFRPALAKLKKDMAKGLFKTVIVNSLDRLSRSLSDYWILEDLFKRHGIGIEPIKHPQKNTPVENFIESLQGTVEKYYKDSLRERRSAGMKRSKKTKTPSLEAKRFLDTK